MDGQPLDPVIASVVVDLPAARAFEAFVGGLGRWWPLACTYSGAQFATAAVEPRAGGRWFERGQDGVETGWGEVRAYDPPRRVVLSFAISPERAPEPPERASEVEIGFIPASESRTRIDLEHRDFERHGEGAAELREGMASPQGWPVILASFARQMEPSPA